MKQLFFIIVLCLSITATSQNIITKDIGEFSIIKVFDLIEVKLIKSTENKVEISGRNTKDVSIINKNGILKIRMALNESFDGSDTYVKVYFTNLDTIDANEGAFISSEDVFEQFDLSLKTQEGAQIKLQTDVKYLDVKAVTGGEVEISGQVDKQIININTGGIYDGKNVESQNSEVSIKAGGEAHIKAIETLDIKIRAGGEVIVYGKPKQVFESKALGGTIKYRD